MRVECRQGRPRCLVEQDNRRDSLGVHFDDLGVQSDPRVQRSIHPSIHARLIWHGSNTRYAPRPTGRMTCFVQLAKDQIGQRSRFVLIRKGGEEVGRVVIVCVARVVEVWDPAPSERSEGLVILGIDFL